MTQLEMETTKRPIFVGGIKQNCYALDYRTGTSSTHSHSRTIPSYYSLEKKMLDNGFVQELVEKDYPINSESVSSYLESSDYRNDPMQAIANAPKRYNLGNIADVQEFVANNPVQATQQYADVLQKVADYFKAQANAKQPVQQSGQANSEVMNNAQ